MDDWSPIIATITALEVPALYSIELKPDTAEASLKIAKMKAGEHSWMVLE